MLSLIAMALAFAGQTSQPTPSVDGVWANPKGTVHVRTGSCGDKICGWITWASPKAQEDARKKGVTQLIGTELLRSYRATDRGHWAGQVYVPDMQSAFDSTITMVDAQTLNIKGCILGGLFCKAQIWRRVASPVVMSAR
jgi:uncharacterized protein (DUF2147 family)